MTKAVTLASVLGLALSASAAQATLPPTPVSDECAVWQRELSFAQSVADHDAGAFAEHLHPDAAFGVGRKPTRGREAITKEWAGLIDGSALKLSWYPVVVTRGADGAAVYSSGPALYEDPGTGEARLGRFGSVWLRGDDGRWRVVFDDGIAPAPADAAAVQRFHEGRKAECPDG
ncbi:nuclear transport factor 2 family protein [Pseudoxanthomonas putridarboris]|uniref:Nuclear transport factor 2 family protein n=1 Tax=Pseudoxanthomonas putridarboris TaxID=752605 RepID=A0ABU9J1K5_9GAMM